VSGHSCERGPCATAAEPSFALAPSFRHGVPKWIVRARLSLCHPPGVGRGQRRRADLSPTLFDIRALEEKEDRLFDRYDKGEIDRAT
jgi:hypothetical protein